MTGDEHTGCSHPRCMIQRIPLLYPEETDEFLPPSDTFGVDDVVQYIKDHAKPRQHVRDAYMTALDSRARGGETAASSYPNTRSRVSIADNSPTATTHATNAGGNQPTATFDGAGTSNTVAIVGDIDDGDAVGTAEGAAVGAPVGE